MPKVEAWVAEKIAAGTSNNCTLETAAVRREWSVSQLYDARAGAFYRNTNIVNRSDLSEMQRQEYVAAVNCLTKLPPRSNQTKFPGALSRFDDFVAFHMTHAMQLHDNLHLFGAHKYYVWLFEKALREECGYTGYQPVSQLRRTEPTGCSLLTIALVYELRSLL